jgi:2-polyprenyl-3-methyl-5-hydroxy-6-metoxy-1,4-benzoquinol methylase
MLQTLAKKAERAAELENYAIRGGKEGAKRLSVLARALAPSTNTLFDRIGPIYGFTVVDAACGGGDVSVELARRAGPAGRVFGFDLDAVKLASAANLARESRLQNCVFSEADVSSAWPVYGVHMVYARFILTHLKEPERLLAAAWNALVPGGLMVVEDIDADGKFWHPPSPAMERFDRLYNEATKLRGGDPFIGRRLGNLLEANGFTDVNTDLVQPFSRSGAPKDAVVMTYHAISGSILASGLASEGELRALYDELDSYAGRSDTVLGMPRIFQAWGIKG